MSLHVSIVAERGVPHDFVDRSREKITAELEDALGREVTVSVNRGALSMAPSGGVNWADSVAQAHDDSSIILFVTELPQLWGRRPVLVEIDVGRAAGIISLPAAGALGMRRKIVSLVVAASVALFDADDSGVDALSASKGRHQWHADEQLDGRSALVTSVTMGRVRMVAGMVRINRPWRLVATLKGVMAAAAATASFGIFYTSIWSMAAALSVRRLAMIMVLSVLVMTAWLIVANRLWERGTYGKVWRRVYNASTLSTVLTGVVTMYAILFPLAFLAGLIVIDPTFMSQKLGGDATVSNYLVLAWLSTSMGVIAGALGSSADSYDDILRATYGNRERERRIADEAEESEEYEEYDD